MRKKPPPVIKLSVVILDNAHHVFDSTFNRNIEARKVYRHRNVVNILGFSGPVWPKGTTVINPVLIGY